MQAATVEFSDLTIRHGANVALSGVSAAFTARRVGVIGRNGSGKTTLARAVCGLIDPAEGQVKVNGVNVAKDRRAALDLVGLIFQNPDHQIIFPTVEEELAFGLEQQGKKRPDARCAAREMLRQFGREGWADRPVATLSQGQRHLVCLMAVLAMEPQLIVLDEPFSGLDIPTRRQLDRLLAELPQSTLHITHDPQTLVEADHVIWLEEGRIAAQGAPAEVIPAFLSAMDALEGIDALADFPD